jgi:hypothetical protein
MSCVVVRVLLKLRACGCRHFTSQQARVMIRNYPSGLIRKERQGETKGPDIVINNRIELAISFFGRIIDLENFRLVREAVWS